MGVMSCSRKDCNNIMCDTYIDDIGYICSECEDEFKKWIETNNIEVNTERDIRNSLMSFMITSKKDTQYIEEMDVYTFFKKYSKN